MIDPERRIVTTEAMTGAPFPPNINDLTFNEVDGVILLVTDADVTQRNMIRATGMTEGMETSSQRLEREILAVV